MQLRVRLNFLAVVTREVIHEPVAVSYIQLFVLSQIQIILSTLAL